MSELRDKIRLFDKRAESYEEYSAWCKDEHLYRLCTDPLRDMIPSIWCLDLACGSGWVGRRNHAETGRRWILMDLSRAMAKFSSSTSIPFVQADAVALPFADGVFAHIVLRSALQYVDGEVVLGEVHRVISSRGHFVIAQKTCHEDSSIAEWHEQLYRLRNVTANQYWKKEGLINSLRLAGFRVMKVYQYKERRQVDIERWINKDGTVPPRNITRIRELIFNTPVSVVEATNQSIASGMLRYDRIWTVAYCRMETVKASLTSAVFSVIVERVVNGQKCVLLQRRRKRFEEPDYVDSWELPQGKLERGMSSTQTIRQELYEETGLTLKEILRPSAIQTSVDFRFADPVDNVTPIAAVRSLGGTDFLALAICVSADGEPTSKDIERGHTWVPTSELRNLIDNDRVYPLNRPMLAEYLRLTGEP